METTDQMEAEARVRKKKRPKPVTDVEEPATLEEAVGELRKSIKNWQRSDAVFQYIHSVRSNEVAAPLMAIDAVVDGQPAKLQVDTGTWEEEDLETFLSILERNSVNDFTRHLAGLAESAAVADHAYRG